MAATLIAASLAAPANPAAAQLTALACTGSQQAHYAPGITNEPQDVHATVNATWDNCTALGSDLTQGHGTFNA